MFQLAAACSDHLHYLRNVLDEFWKAVLTAKTPTHLGLTDTQYLGYNIGWGLLKLQEKKIVERS